MENATVVPIVPENGGLPRAALMEVDDRATKNNGAYVPVTISPVAQAKECGNNAAEDVSPAYVMQENKSPAVKVGAGLPMRKPLPFRERNMEEGKRLLPPHIEVPPKKLFGYPERYRSPTDAMVSPVSRGLLTRNRRPGRTLAPIVPPKALETTFQDVVMDVVVGEEGLLNQVPT